MSGIHDNTECERCGACCIYFEITVPDTENPPLIAKEFPVKVWKKAGEVCQYLNYDNEKNVAACTAPENERPKQCYQFDCWDPMQTEYRKEKIAQLKDLSAKVEELVNSS